MLTGYLSHNSFPILIFIKYHITASISRSYEKKYAVFRIVSILLGRAKYFNELMGQLVKITYQITNLQVEGKRNNDKGKTNSVCQAKFGLEHYSGLAMQGMCK